MNDFISFARSYGLILDHAEASGKWVAVRTEDKPKKRNGRYIMNPDGCSGAVINYATMSTHASWRADEKIRRVVPTISRASTAAEDRQKQERARGVAAEMLKAATFSEHPYLAAKGFPKEKGFVLNGELLIPMRDFDDYSVINSLQRIDADGGKKFLPGGKAKGSIYRMGLMEKGAAVWIVEGLATGLSVLKALAHMRTQAQVICCFSAGNMEFVGKKLKGAFCMADNDESQAGEKSAIASGLRYCMPPEVGTDANDLERKAGVVALAKLMREVTVRAMAA